MFIEVDGIEIDLLVGADPEIFVTKDGKLVSAHGVVKGNKEHPYRVSKGAIQVDGMALEFNIDPATDCTSFLGNINTVMAELKKHMPKTLELSDMVTAEFGSEYIDKQPYVAKELGCSSDHNAYLNSKNPKPDQEVDFRTAAGHIHIGWTEEQDINNPEYLELCCEFTKVLDLYLGVPSVLLDKDTKRRSLYGAAGAFRAKEYGLEYRVLSNFWLRSDTDKQWVYDQVVKAISEFLGGLRLSDNDVIDTINNSRVLNAKLLVSKYNIKVPSYG